MAILIYQDASGRYMEREFSEEVRIGSDPQRNDVVLPAEWDVAPEHAVITRSALNRMPLLVDLIGRGTKVNGQQIVRIRVLRQGDDLQIGQARLTLWEVRIARLLAGSRVVGRECPVCTDEFRAGDEVVVCPRCRTVHHRDCWFRIQVCAYYGCGYPIHETVMDTLAPWVVFDRKLDGESELVRNKKSCVAGNQSDQAPFQEGQKVAYCPSCHTPFHLECWLRLVHCPVCQYPVRELINRVFAAGYDSVSVPPTTR